MTDAALHQTTADALTDLIHHHTPAWLDKAGLATEAASLRELPAIVDLTTLGQAAETVQPMMMTAYRLAGITAWPQAAPGAALVAATDMPMVMLNAAGPYPHGHPLRSLVDQLAGWAHTVAVYAAHATTLNGAAA